jgi:hypothetical protein
MRQSGCSSQKKYRGGRSKKNHRKNAKHIDQSHLFGLLLKTFVQLQSQRFVASSTHFYDCNSIQYKTDPTNGHLQYETQTSKV